MGKFTVDPEFWALFPEARLEVLIVNNIKNQCNEENAGYFTGLLSSAAKEAANYLTEETFSQNQVINEWRQAFGKFKTKKGARSSLEALLKRVNQGRVFTPINPLVDIYNSISLKYAVPCGGEDLHAIDGDMHLGKAKGGEPFMPLGATENSPALPEEIIYYDGTGAICRCLNWREAQRTMLTDETKDAILVIESVNSEQAERAGRAIAEMKQLIDTYFGTESIGKTVTKVNPTFHL